MSIIIISSVFAKANSELSGYWKLMNSKLAPEFCGYKILEFKTDSTYSFLNRQSSTSNAVEYAINWKEQKINIPTRRVEESPVTSFLVHNPDSITFSVHTDEFVMTKISELEAKYFSELFNESQLLIELPTSPKTAISQKELDSIIWKNKKERYQFFVSIANSVSELPLARINYFQSNSNQTMYKMDHDDQIRMFSYLNPTPKRAQDTALFYKAHQLKYTEFMVPVFFLDKSVPFRDFQIFINEIRFNPHIETIFIAYRTNSEKAEINYFPINKNEYVIQGNNRTFGQWFESGHEIIIGDRNDLIPIQVIEDDE